MKTVIQSQIDVWQTTKQELLYLYRTRGPNQEAMYDKLMDKAQEIINALKDAEHFMQIATERGYKLTREV